MFVELERLQPTNRVGEGVNCEFPTPLMRTEPRERQYTALATVPFVYQHSEFRECLITMADAGKYSFYIATIENRC